jgi:predicted dehydrogenase
VLESSCRHARLQPKFTFVKNLIDSGKLGMVYFVHHVHVTQGTFVEYNPNGAWGMDKKRAGGGPVFDWGVYDFSFHLGVLGDTLRLAKVNAFTRNDCRDLSALAPIADVEQHGVALLEFDQGVRYYYERGGGAHGEVPNGSRIYGTRGGIHFSYTSWESPEIQFYHAGADGKQKPAHETFTVDMSGHTDDNQEFIRHFIDCLEKKAKPAMTVAMAARHLDILFKITGI